jgi:hypothetical protein
MLSSYLSGRSAEIADRFAELVRRHFFFALARARIAFICALRSAFEIPFHRAGPPRFPPREPRARRYWRRTSSRSVFGLAIDQ